MILALYKRVHLYNCSKTFFIVDISNYTPPDNLKDLLKYSLFLQTY